MANKSRCGLLAFILLFTANAWAEKIMIASWYSRESLIKEGTYVYSKGIMANGKKFSDTDFTAATRLFPLGTILRISALTGNRWVVVRVTDRIGKRFAKTRVDLSRAAFQQIANLDDGLCKVRIEEVALWKQSSITTPAQKPSRSR